jgi:hypothetical protein
VAMFVSCVVFRCARRRSASHCHGLIVALFPSRARYLDLSTNFLSGTIPDFSSMTTLEYMALCGNTFPGELSSLPWGGGNPRVFLLTLSRCKVRGRSVPQRLESLFPHYTSSCGRGIYSPPGGAQSSSGNHGALCLCMAGYDLQLCCWLQLQLGLPVPEREPVPRRHILA